MLESNLKNTLSSLFKPSLFPLQSLLPQLKILGDGSNNLILEKPLTSIPVTGLWTVNDVPFVESAITNLILQSDNVLSGTWIATGTKTQNGTVKSPMGDTDIPLLDLASLGLLYQDLSLPAGTYTQSFYYYATHQQILGVCVPDSTSTGGSRQYIDIVATNRWQKHSYTFTLSTTTTIRTLIETRNAGGIAQLNKPNTSGLGAFMGFQIEAGSIAKTRVPTTTTSATRASSIANGACFGVAPSDVNKIIKFVPNETAYISASKKYIAKFFTINIGQSKAFYAWKLNRALDFLSPRLKQFGRRLGYYGATVTQDANNKVIPFDNPAHWNETLSATIPSFPDPNSFDIYDCSYSGFGLSQFCDDIDLELVLFPENRGGTGFYYDATNNPNTWRYDGTGTLYNSLINRVDNFISQFPDAKCIGIISDIQELDISANMSWATFKSYLTGLCSNLRSKPWALNNTIPVFHVPFSATWTGGDSALKTQYYNGLRALGSEVSNYYCVDTLAQASGVNVYRSNGEIFGGTTPDYTHLSNEAGRLIGVEMASFFKQTYPNNNIIVPTTLPVNTVAPVISGSGFITDTLSATLGTWTGGQITYSYQWKRNGINISGATNSTYIITSSDFETSITCSVTATNLSGAVNASSNTISIFTQYNYDAFTDTNGVTLNNHTGNYNASWGIQSGSIASHAQIQNGRLISIATSNVYRMTTLAPVASYKVFARFVCVSELTSDSIGITGRATNDSMATFYFVRYSRATTSWGLFRNLPGVSTQLSTSYTDAFTLNSVRDVELIMNGTSISVVIDGVTRISATDSMITGAGSAGFRGGATQSATTGIHIDYIYTRPI
jgi:hypothetical protein